MRPKKTENRPFDRLVALIEQDILNRGLQSGDRYITTQEVAGLFHVSTRLANDALSALAERQIVQRRPKSGTIIGPEAGAAAGAVLDVVHMLVRQNYFFAEQSQLEALVLGVVRELPGTAIQYSFVPSFNEVNYVQRLIRGNEAAKLRAGYLIAVKSPELQDFMQKLPTPVVLLGTPFPGVTGLPWVDKDQRKIGSLLAGELLKMGCRRLGVILRERRGYGDDLLMDGITHEILDANLGTSALVIRSASLDSGLAMQTALTLLRREDRPTGIICRTKLIHDAVLAACREVRLKPGRDLRLALCNPSSSGIDERITLRPKAQMNAESEGRIAGKMLQSMAQGGKAEPRFSVTPVHL